MFTINSVVLVSPSSKYPRKKMETNSQPPEEFSSRRLVLKVLALLFGVSAWLGINSSYVELPLLVQTAPESWSLPSYMVIVIQLANLPLLFTCLQRARLLNNSAYIFSLLLVGFVGAIVFGFVYEKTTKIFDEDRSLALLVIVFGFALVGCTSSVAFMPYMGRLRFETSIR